MSNVNKIIQVGLLSDYYIIIMVVILTNHDHFDLRLG